MAEFLDLTGQKYGYLTIIELHIGGYDLYTKWICKCVCGNKSIVSSSHLRSGHTKSCGCKKGKQVFENLIGKKYNRLTVLSIYSKANKKIRWKCICDCGNYNIVVGSNLKNGAVKSCGCLSKELHYVKHGLGGTRLYAIWDNMKGRCYRPSMPAYKNYGAKGIIICDEWMNDCTLFFKWAVENGYNDSLTIERDNNFIGYCPSNCRWIPQIEQARNKTVSLGVDKVKEIKKMIQNKVSLLKISKIYNVHPSTISNIKRNKSYSYIKN